MDKKITNVPGRLHNVAVDEHGNQEPLTGANEIMDDALGKMQNQINAERIADIQEEATRAGREEANLRTQIAATQKQDVIPVETLPAVATADPKKIYRVAGETSYTDYMVNATGDGWQLLGTFELPGVDDEPTAGSDHLVKSGGVAKSVNLQIYTENAKANNYIKELYLINPNPDVPIRVYGIGTYDNGNRQTITFFQGGNTVAQADGIIKNGIYRVFQLQNSGVEGYIIFDVSSMQDIQFLQQAWLTTLVYNIENSPTIYSYLKKQETDESISFINNKINKIDDVISFNERELINISTTLSNDWINSDSTQVNIGYNKTYEKDVLLKKVEIFMDASNLNVGGTMNVVVGLLDQRGWFIKDKEIPCTIISKDNNIVVLEPQFISIIPAGKMIVVACGYKWGFWSNTTYVQQVMSEYGKMINVDLSNLPTGVSQRADVTERLFKLYIEDVDSIFTTKQETDELNRKVNINSAAIALSKIFIDEQTGIRYKLYVKNGAISLKDLTINKALFLGNSYTAHGNSEGVWWGNGRGMAASVDATQYTSLIAEKTGAQITKGNYADFEIHHSPSYNFAENIHISNGEQYNLVVIQLFENATYNSSMQESWEALYDYVREQCPNATTIQIIGWYQQEKANAVYAAAREKDVVVLDCSDFVSKGMYSIGDYVTDSNGNYHAIENSGVAGHPSDIGLYGIASKILEEYAEDISEKLKNITISSIVGGSISVPFNKWVVGGVVNVRVISGTINSVVVNNGSVSVTKQDNSHFTFIMPNEDVTITAE